PLRPWRDGRFLDVRFDSTLFNNGTRVLCINGQVMQYGDTVGSPGVQIIVGTVMRREAQVINNSGMPPVTGDYFWVAPNYENITDSQGRFSLCAKIDSSSSLLIASDSYYLELYKVGKLVDSAWTQ